MVRDLWADILSFALRSVVDCPEDFEAWSRLFMLPKCILFLPPFKVRKKVRSLISLIKERIKAWKDGSFLDLWEKACNRASSNLTSQSSSLCANRSRAAVQNDRFRKALQILDSQVLPPQMRSPMPPCSPNTLKAPPTLSLPLASNSLLLHTKGPY